MHRILRPAALVPTGLVVQSSALDGDQAVITVRAASQESICPACSLPAGLRKLTLTRMPLPAASLT
jgi:hypothetical protein